MLTPPRHNGARPATRRHNCWNVGVIPLSVEALVRGERAEPRWLPERRGHYAADPFPIEIDGRLHLFFEDYSYGTGQGVIAHAELDDDLERFAPRQVIDTGTHASYPQVFALDGDVVMIPETAAAGEVAIYKARRFPDDWVKTGVVLQDIRAVDPTVFRHEGMWWVLFVSYDDLSRSQLFAAYAPEITGPWRAHERNPIKVDVVTARPAGRPFAIGGELFRPAQDCSVTYGARTVINRLHELTPSSFEEEAVTVLEPDPDGRYPVGMHTLSPVRDTTFVDGNRWILSPRATTRGLLERMVRRLRGRSPVDQPYGRRRTDPVVKLPEF